MSTERGDLPEIRPRVVDGVGYCDAGCPQACEQGDAVFCSLDDLEYSYPVFGPDEVLGEVCLHWASRTAARLAEVEEWAEEAREYILGSEPYVRMYGLECVKDRIDPLLSSYPGTDDQEGGE